MKKISFFFITSLILSSCSNENKPGEVAESATQLYTITFTKAQAESAGIRCDSLQQRVISNIINVHGRVEAPPQNYVSISAPLGGFLKSTELLPGMKVVKGEVLAMMEDQMYVQLQQDYLYSKAKINAFEKEYLRQRTLNETKASSDKQMELAESDYFSEKAVLAGLREKLRLAGVDPEKLNEASLSKAIPLLSPITGYVARVNVNVGKHVAPNDVLFELVNPDDIHLALTVFEKDIDRIRVGQMVKASTNHAPKIYNCEVILLGRNLNPDRSLEIHCHFNKYDHSLLPGMYMNAEILTDTIPVPALPEEAIVQMDKKNYVFIQTAPLTYEMQEVIVGGTAEGFSEITNSNNLKGREIVIKGAYSILMKMKNKE